MLMLLAAMFLWQNAPSQVGVPDTVPVASVPVDPLPESPGTHYLRDVASRVALVVSTRKVFRVGRVYGGGVSVEVAPQLTVSGGYENQGWAAGVIIRPFPKRRDTR